VKKTLLITFNFYPEVGSAANRMKNIYQLLKQAGHSVTVLTCEPCYPNRNLYQDQAFWNEDISEDDIIRVKIKSRKYDSHIWRRLLFYAEASMRFILSVFKLKKNFDIVFVSIPPLPTAFAGIYAKFRFKAKLITDIRDLSADSLRGASVFRNRLIVGLANLIERTAIKKSHHVVVNSEGFIPAILKYKSKQNFTYMPNALSENELNYKKDRNRIDSNEIIVIYSGNIGLAQNVRKLVDVAEQLKNVPNISFEIIGYGFRRQEIKALISEKQLPNVKFHEAMNRHNTLKRVANADIAFVSLSETKFLDSVLPGKIIDYLGMGIPVVADVSGYSQLIIEKANGGCIPSNRDILSVNQNIQALANNADLRKQLGDNGYQFATQHFRWQTNITRLLSILEET